jgi:hypothetical protein
MDALAALTARGEFGASHDIVRSNRVCSDKACKGDVHSGKYDLGGEAHCL